MSNTLNITRHEHVFDPSKFAYPIHIVGAGATGSRVFAALVELGMPNINIYDPDIVEEHNLANQIFLHEDIGQTKVSACSHFVRRKLGRTPPRGYRFAERRVNRRLIVEMGGLNSGVVFLMTDTMKSREDIFNALTTVCDDKSSADTADSMRTAPLLVIETRMGSTHGTVFTLNPFDRDQRKAWHNTLIDDEDEDNLELSPCGTTLSVGTTASLIANYAVWQMMQFFVDPLGMQPRLDLFFKPTLTITSQEIAA